ncbi:MAG: exo-alpha-sialidase [Eggerthellaceae bacterium]|nr:exo-alpha-sialidase [Eggerthellaceae bacterium]
MKTTIRLIHRDTLSCEPILRRMPNGDLLCVSQVGDVAEPAPLNRIRSFRSTDDGLTWSKSACIYPETGQAVYATEFNVVDGIARVYGQTHSGRFLNMGCFVMESDDNGHTWHNAGIPPFFPAFTFFRGLLELRDGTQLLPYQHMPVSEQENMRLVTASHGISDYKKQRAVWDADICAIQNGVVLTAPGGFAPELCPGPEIPIKGDTGRRWAWSEPTLIELSDGRVVMLLRVDKSGCLWRSDSFDGGKTWTKAEPTDIPNPDNKPKLLAFPDGRIGLIHTPNGNPGFSNRYPLALWISHDDMLSWEEKHVLTDFPGIYCYPDGFVEGNKLYFTIEINRHEILFFLCEDI